MSPTRSHTKGAPPHPSPHAKTAWDESGHRVREIRARTTIACFKLSSFRNFSTFCFISTSSLIASCLEDVLSKSLPVSYSLHIHHIARIRSNRLQAYAEIVCHLCSGGKFSTVCLWFTKEVEVFFLGSGSHFRRVHEARW